MLEPRLIDPGNSVNRDHPLNKDLVSWWMPLSNNSGGSTLFDIAGRFHGTLINVPSWDSGRPSTYGPSGGFPSLKFRFELNAAAVYVSCSDLHDTIEGLTKVVISAWIYRVAGGFSSVMQGNIGAERFGFVWYSDNNIYVINSGQVSFLDASDQTWVHLITAYDGTQATNTTKLRVWVNGQPVSLGSSGTVGTTVPATSTVFAIGRGADNAQFISDSGKTTDVRVYTNRLWTDQDSLALYQQSFLGHPDTLRRFVSSIWSSPGITSSSIFNPYYYQMLAGGGCFV